MIDNAFYLISCKAFFKSILHNYDIPFIDNIKDDLISEGVLAILENENNFKHLKDIDLFKARYNVAKRAMYNFIYKNVTKEKCVSSFEDFDVSTGNLSDFLETFDNYALDLKFILKKYNECLKEFSLQNSKVLKSYFFDNLSMKEILKKYEITKNDFITLVRKFRFKFFELLKNYDYFYSYVETFDEFQPTESEKRKAIKKEALKQNKQIYFDDLLIYKLMRENSNNDYAYFLQISPDYLKKILNRSSWVFKLKSYQVQSLRKQFFNNYSLESLLSGVAYA